MNQTQRQKARQKIRNDVGSLSSKLRWFSEEETQRANRQKKELLEILSDWITSSCHKLKLHHGPLSPGCRICSSGGRETHYLNYLCTRRCFYCPQKLSSQEDGISQTEEGIPLRDPAEHIEFLKKFQIRGIDFTGGEPLLSLDRLLGHLAAVRQQFGDSLYIWMNTNGDLLDASILHRLAKGGLNEIRIHLSAYDYDLTSVRLAKAYIPTVTVENPAIPEDLDRFQSLLEEMEVIGVNFLILHQLHTSQQNYRSYLRRNYHFLHQPLFPIFESEICALRLFLYAKVHRIHLPMEYCRAAYKPYFKGQDIRVRQWRIVQRDFEEMTPTGYIRSLEIADNSWKIEKLIQILEKAAVPKGQWQWNGENAPLKIHRVLLPYVDWSTADLTIQYFHPLIGLKKSADGFGEANLIPQNFSVYRRGGWSRIGIESWQQLYVERRNPQEVFRHFFQNVPVKGREAISRIQQEAGELKKMAEWETMHSGLQEIF